MRPLKRCGESDAGKPANFAGSVGTEPDLYPRAAGRANRTGWYLYNRAPDMESIISHQPLEYNRYLNKLVARAGLTAC